MNDEKPNIHTLNGSANVAAAIYLEGHFRATQRMTARDLMEKDPERYTSFEQALEMVKYSHHNDASKEEIDRIKREGHFNLLSMGMFGDLSEADIP